MAPRGTRAKAKEGTRATKEKTTAKEKKAEAIKLEQEVEEELNKEQEDAKDIAQEIDEEIVAAETLAKKASIGFGGIQWCDRDGKLVLDVETRKYNARELDKGHWTGIMSSLLSHVVKPFGSPMRIAVNPEDILNLTELLNADTSNPKTIPIVKFRSGTIKVVLLAGQHRIEAILNTVPQLVARILKQRVELQSARDDLHHLVGRDVDVEMQGLDLEEKEEEEAVPVVSEEGNDGEEGGGEKDGEQDEETAEGEDGEEEMDEDGEEKRTERELRKRMREVQRRERLLRQTKMERMMVQHWYTELFDINLLTKGKTTKQLFRVLAENTQLKERPKMIQEMILDAVTDLVEYDGKEEARRVRASFPDRPAKVREVLVRPSLCDTLYHIARLSDAFKVGNLFKGEWLATNLLKSKIGDMLIYLIRDSVLTFGRVYEYRRDKEVLPLAVIEGVAERVKEGQTVPSDAAMIKRLQDTRVREDRERRQWNSQHPDATIPLICDTDIVSRNLLEGIDHAFQQCFLQDENVLKNVGTDAQVWDDAMDQYVEDVVTEMEKDVENRPQGKEDSIEREIQRQSPSLFRIMYTRLEGRPRAIPVITPTMLDEIIKTLKVRGLSMAEIARWFDALANFVVFGTSNTHQGGKKALKSEDDVGVRNPRSFPEVISAAVRLHAQTTQRNKHDIWLTETVIVPLFWRFFLSFYAPEGGIEYLESVLLTHDLNRPIVPDPTIHGGESVPDYGKTLKVTYFRESWTANKGYHPEKIHKRKVVVAASERSVWDRIFRVTTWARGTGGQDTGKLITKVYPWLNQETGDKHCRPAAASQFAIPNIRPADDQYPDCFDGGKIWYGPVRAHRERLNAAPEIAKLRKELGDAIQYCTGQKGPYPFWDGLDPATSTAVPFQLSPIDTGVLLRLKEEQAGQQAELVKLREILVQKCAINPRDKKTLAVTTPDIDLAINHLLSKLAATWDTRRLHTAARDWAGQDSTGGFVQERLKPMLDVMLADTSLQLQIPTTKRAPLGITEEDIISGTTGMTAEKPGPSRLIPKLNTVIVNADDVRAGPSSKEVLDHLIGGHPASTGMIQMDPASEDDVDMRDLRGAKQEQSSQLASGLHSQPRERMITRSEGGLDPTLTGGATTSPASSPHSSRPPSPAVRPDYSQNTEDLSQKMDQANIQDVTSAAIPAKLKGKARDDNPESPHVEPIDELPDFPPVDVNMLEDVIPPSQGGPSRQSMDDVVPDSQDVQPFDHTMSPTPAHVTPPGSPSSILSHPRPSPEDTRKPKKAKTVKKQAKVVTSEPEAPAQKPVRGRGGARARAKARGGRASASRTPSESLPRNKSRRESKPTDDLDPDYLDTEY